MDLRVGGIRARGFRPLRDKVGGAGLEPATSCV
jgi:hypothetical protein